MDSNVLEASSWILATISAFTATIALAFTLRTSRTAFLASKDARQAADNASVSLASLKELGIDYETLRATGATVADLERLTEALDQKNSSTEGGGPRIPEVEIMTQLVRIAAHTSRRAELEVHRRSRRDQIAFFAFGIAVSLPISLLIDYLMR